MWHAICVPCRSNAIPECSKSWVTVFHTPLLRSHIPVRVRTLCYVPDVPHATVPLHPTLRTRPALSDSPDPSCVTYLPNPIKQTYSTTHLHTCPAPSHRPAPPCITYPPSPVPQSCYTCVTYQPAPCHSPTPGGIASLPSPVPQSGSNPCYICNRSRATVPGHPVLCTCPALSDNPQLQATDPLQAALHPRPAPCDRPIPPGVMYLMGPMPQSCSSPRYIPINRPAPPSFTYPPRPVPQSRSLCIMYPTGLVPQSHSTHVTYPPSPIQQTCYTPGYVPDGPHATVLFHSTSRTPSHI